MTQEIITLNGDYYIICYQTLQQRQMALDEFQRGVPVDQIGAESEYREKRFGM